MPQPPGLKTYSIWRERLFHALTTWLFPWRCWRQGLLYTMFQSLVNLRKDLPKMKRMVSGKTAGNKDQAPKWKKEGNKKNIKKDGDSSQQRCQNGNSIQTCVYISICTEKAGICQVRRTSQQTVHFPAHRVVSNTERSSLFQQV